MVEGKTSRSFDPKTRMVFPDFKILQFCEMCCK